MARQGQIFLQYFAELLDTPPQGTRRVVYFDGEDLGEALERLGTMMLDAEASRAIFDGHSRLHRDVLADATPGYLKKLTGTV
ncbi:MAG: hypothetical protein WBV18_01340 [Methyloceanibacter sp.]|jgi:hypothetical protein|uniref:hypothetical protein n=1 Tax=Methyloceanibacter sp. TaxID=1965321 RepID=UPI003C4EB3A5